MKLKFINSDNIIKIIIIIGIILTSTHLLSKRKKSDMTEDGRVIVTYWEKWGSFEYDVMKSVVDDFNNSQDKIYVDILTVGDIDKKVMLATSGGNPPDIAGLWDVNINDYSVKNALTPLNSFIKEAGFKREDFIPSIWDFNNQHGFIWGLPSSPLDYGMYWNKRLFRESGLDPEVYPKTLDELQEISDILTIVKIQRNRKEELVSFSKLTEKEKKAKNFTIEQLGFSPSTSGWDYFWGYWFDSKLWNKNDKITLLNPENIEAVKWFSSYGERYGINNLNMFKGSFGSFGAMNPFVAEKVAIVYDGSWFYNYFEMFNPSIEWGAAPFPNKEYVPGRSTTVVGYDVLVIPKGAKHPREAFEFMKYVNTQGPMEKLCTGHKKFSSLSNVSDGFIENHPHPQIKVFMDMAYNPGARTIPKIPIWYEYRSSITLAYQQAFNGIYSPEVALEKAQKRSQWNLDRFMRRWSKVKDRRIEQWHKDSEELAKLKL